MGWVVAFFAITVLMAAIAIFGRVSDSKIKTDRRSALYSTLSSIPGFTADSYVYSSDFARMLAVDKSSKRMCLIKARRVLSDNSDRAQRIAYRDPSFSSGFMRVVDAHDILSVEVEEDGMRPNAVGRAIAGGVIAGPAGAVVGAMTSGAHGAPTTAATRIDLKVMVSDITDPLLVINFLNMPKGDASRERGTAQEWQARVKVLAHLAKLNGDARGNGPIS